MTSSVVPCSPWIARARRAPSRICSWSICLAIRVRLSQQRCCRSVSRLISEPGGEAVLAGVGAAEEPVIAEHDRLPAAEVLAARVELHVEARRLNGLRLA